jgi:hypothetical protein
MTPAPAVPMTAGEARPSRLTLRSSEFLTLDMIGPHGKEDTIAINVGDVVCTALNERNTVLCAFWMLEQFGYDTSRVRKERHK